MPTLRQRCTLAPQCAQGAADVVAGVARADDRVDIAAFGGEIGGAVVALVRRDQAGAIGAAIHGAEQATLAASAPVRAAVAG